MAQLLHRGKHAVLICLSPIPLTKNYVNFLRQYNFQESQLRCIPITSITELPRVVFHIGLEVDMSSMTTLFDTGGVLNTDNLSLHLHIQATLTSIVAAYNEFNGANLFDLTKLCSALVNPSDYDDLSN